MAKNDVSVDQYDTHEIQLIKNSFLLFRADMDIEMWVLVPRAEGAEMYLRQKRFGFGSTPPNHRWKLWKGKSKVRVVSLPKVTKALTGGAQCFCRVGPLNEIMDDLKTLGIDEQHVEVLAVRTPD